MTDADLIAILLIVSISTALFPRLRLRGERLFRTRRLRRSLRRAVRRELAPDPAALSCRAARSTAARRERSAVPPARIAA